jgi:hypothetical protein
MRGLVSCQPSALRVRIRFALAPTPGPLKALPPGGVQVSTGEFRWCRRDGRRRASMDQGADMGRVTGGLWAPGARENLNYGVERGRHVTPPPPAPAPVARYAPAGGGEYMCRFPL